jgi:hypothetical protein
MKVGELIKELQAFDSENHQPRPRLMTISQQDSRETGDCEDRVGESVVRLGLRLLLAEAVVFNSIPRGALIVPRGRGAPFFSYSKEKM